MSPSFPRHPSPDLLKKQAKMLLNAQKKGARQSCGLFRKLHRFNAATDEEILRSEVSLAEAQFALSLHYGFSGWKEMMEEARSHPPNSEGSLEAVWNRAEAKIPDYAGAGVPTAVVAALNHMGFDLGYMAFAASSGWAFSFGYHYQDISPAYLAIRGRPGRDGPSEVFSSVPTELGLGYELALTEDPESLWAFVREKVDARIPVMSEHMDGGLIPAYRTKNGNRQIFLDATVLPGWTDVDGLNPYAVYSFVRESDPLPEEERVRNAIQRAVDKGRASVWEGVPQGMAALEAYLADVSDGEKDFAHCEEWFCWAAFERLLARRCSEVWLESIGARLPRETGARVTEAAAHYGEAFRSYNRFMGEVQACDPPGRSLFDRARSPGKIETITPILEAAISHEAAGLDTLEAAVRLLS